MFSALGGGFCGAFVSISFFFLFSSSWSFKDLIVSFISLFSFLRKEKKCGFEQWPHVEDEEGIIFIVFFEKIVQNHPLASCFLGK